MVSNPEILIFMLSARSEHLFTYPLHYKFFIDLCLKRPHPFERPHLHPGMATQNFLAMLTDFQDTALLDGHPVAYLSREAQSKILGGFGMTIQNHRLLLFHQPACLELVKCSISRGLYQE